MSGINNDAHAVNRRSRLLTEGVVRSPNRAMLRAVGFADGDFAKPIIGVANAHSTMNPCNAGIQPLVDRAVVALEAAGYKPQVFGIPTVTDEIGMGTEAMKYSLVSREVIADAIEVAVNGQMMDGVLVVGGCDKNNPAGMIALARMDVPGLYVYTGTIKPGRWKNKDLTVVSAFEAVGAYGAGRMAESDFIGIERNACPSVGACGGMYSASTMACSFEALGMSVLGSSTLTAVGPDKLASIEVAARVLTAAVQSSLTPRQIITRQSIENAVALVMATGGSTNAVLHYLAIAAAAGVPWTLDDFERVRGKVPVLCDLKPSGRYVIVDFHRAGGTPGSENASGQRRLERRVHDHRRQDVGRESGGCPRKATGWTGRDPTVVRPHVPRGASRHFERQSCTERLRREDYRIEDDVHHRSRTCLQFRRRLHGGHSGAND